MPKKTNAQYDVKHYCFNVIWSVEDQIFISKVSEFPSLSAHGSTPEEALKEIQFVTEAVIQDLKLSQEYIPEPFSHREFSGKLNVRMPKNLHRELAISASQQGVSLNQMINLKLALS